MPHSLAVITNSVHNIAAYKDVVFQIPKLEKQEEYDLAIRFQQQGCVESAQKLTLSHLRYVVNVANGFRGYGLDEGDIIQEGNIGLMKAINNFMPEQGNRLVTYAMHWIKAEINEFVIKNVDIIRMATTKAQRKLFFNLKRLMRDNPNSYLTEEQRFRIAEKIDVTEKDVSVMETRFKLPSKSFDAPASNGEHDNDVQTLHDIIHDDSDVEHVVLQERKIERDSHSLYAALEKLDDRSKDIVISRHLPLDKKATLSSLSKKYGVSLERIRQIESNALRDMKLTLMH